MGLLSLILEGPALPCWVLSSCHDLSCLVSALLQQRSLWEPHAPQATVSLQSGLGWYLPGPTDFLVLEHCSCSCVTPGFLHHLREGCRLHT